MKSNNKYNVFLRITHWVVGIIIISMIALGFYMTSLSNNTSYKFTLYNIHKPVGLLVLAIVVFRIIIRNITTIPPYSAKIAPIFINLAKINHYLLYVFMILIPSSGYVMSSASGKTIKIFSLSIPLLISQNKNLATIANNLHSIFVYIMVFLIVLHILGALKHLIIDKENIFKRIL